MMTGDSVGSNLPVRGTLE